VPKKSCKAQKSEKTQKVNKYILYVATTISWYKPGFSCLTPLSRATAHGQSCPSLIQHQHISLFKLSNSSNIVAWQPGRLLRQISSSNSDDNLEVMAGLWVAPTTWSCKRTMLPCIPCWRARDTLQREWWGAEGSSEHPNRLVLMILGRCRARAGHWRRWAHVRWRWVMRWILVVGGTKRCRRRWVWGIRGRYL
jgi:hypothetical protein